MALDNVKSKFAKVTDAVAQDVLENTEVYKSWHIGQINILNNSQAANEVYVSVLESDGTTRRMLLAGNINGNFSRITDERKVPTELKPGWKVQVWLGTADAAGMDVEVAYLV